MAATPAGPGPTDSPEILVGGEQHEPDRRQQEQPGQCGHPLRSEQQPRWQCQLGGGQEATGEAVVRHHHAGVEHGSGASRDGHRLGRSPAYPVDQVNVVKTQSYVQPAERLATGVLSQSSPMNNPHATSAPRSILAVGMTPDHGPLSHVKPIPPGVPYSTQGTLGMSNRGDGNQVMANRTVFAAAVRAGKL